jgi:hypothetical protein
VRGATQRRLWALQQGEQQEEGGSGSGSGSSSVGAVVVGLRPLAGSATLRRGSIFLCLFGGKLLRGADLGGRMDGGGTRRKAREGDRQRQGELEEGVTRLGDALLTFRGRPLPRFTG